MARRASSKKKPSRTRRKRRWRLPAFLPSSATRRRWWKAFRRAPVAVQAIGGIGALFLAWFVVNGVYQVILKPTELFFPVSGVLYKTPSQTWRSYERIFRKHSTSTISPELLAALAQVEGSGNPVVRTYWRWSLTSHPFKLYRPASSAVGMYQITNGTFEEARRYCIRDHVVVEDGPWHDWRSCWFNGLYMRVIPSHAVELTSAYLDRKVTSTLARHRIVNATPKQKQDLAAVIHLCGAGAGNRFASRGLRLSPRQRCGDHDVSHYLAKVEHARQIFARLSAASSK